MTRTTTSSGKHRRQAKGVGTMDIKEFISKYKRYIVGFIVVAVMVVLMIIFAVRSPEPALSGFIGVIGTVLGVAVSQLTQLSITEQEERAKFRLAALDKRLEVHQKAYTLWQELMSSLYDEDRRSNAIRECETFFKNNCLYIDEKARTPCHSAIYNAILVGQTSHAMNGDERAQISTEMGEALHYLETAVGLPAIGDFTNYPGVR